MGKRIISRARGKGGPRYRAPTHRYLPKPEYPVMQKNAALQAKVIDIVHDPARNAPLAKIKFESGDVKNIIAVEGIKVGDAVLLGGLPKHGSVTFLSEIPEGSAVCAIELYPGSGPKLCKSSGVSGMLISRGDKVVIQMSSGELKEFDPRCLATVGAPAGGGRKDKPYVKAGQMFYAKGARVKLWPRSSGVKMNPVDHPFGGKTKPGWPKSVSRHAPPGQKVGSIASRRTGKRKK